LHPEREISTKCLLEGIALSIVFALSCTLLGGTKFMVSRIDVLLNSVETFFDTRLKIYVLSSFFTFLSPIYVKLF